MRLNILIGGKAGQGINKISEIISNILAKQGYFTFNYRDYPSLIRGGHNFNVLSISDTWIASHESKLDGIIAMDEKTIPLHKTEIKSGAFTIPPTGFEDLGLNLNVALAGALTKLLGIDKQILLDEIQSNLKNQESIDAAEKGYNSQSKEIISLKKLNNQISILSGSMAIAKGAINSNIDLYIAYPMTPATGVFHELAAHQDVSALNKSASKASLSVGGGVGAETENNFKVFQAESEIAVVNSALGASFAGKKVMIGTSGGGFDLMSEALSFQGQSEIPLTVYLASRPGPGTGVPTYTSQADLDIALRGGHGEFPRIVIAPGDPIEAIEITNQAMYLAEKFSTLSIILSDKHLAESEFSLNKQPNKPLKINITRKIPGKAIVKSNSYEHDLQGNTTESAEITKQNAENRIKKYNLIKKEIEKFQPIKIHGKQNSKNLIIGWGSTKGAILDAIKEINNKPEKNNEEKQIDDNKIGERSSRQGRAGGLVNLKQKKDCKFMQILYMKPMSSKIKQIMQQANNIILIENNLTGQLGRVLREKTGIEIPKENRILKYDGRPFYSDQLKLEIEKRLK